MLKVLPRESPSASSEQSEKEADASAAQARWQKVRKASVAGYSSGAEKSRAKLQVTLEEADGKSFERVAIAPTYTG